MPLTFAFFTCAMLLVVPARNKTAASTITIIKVVNFRIVFPLFVYGLIGLRTLLQLGEYRLGYHAFSGLSKISFADCAHAMIRMLDDDTWLHKAPIVQY